MADPLADENLIVTGLVCQIEMRETDTESVIAETQSQTEIAIKTEIEIEKGGKIGTGTGGKTGLMITAGMRAIVIEIVTEIGIEAAGPALRDRMRQTETPGEEMAGSLLVATLIKTDTGSTSVRETALKSAGGWGCDSLDPLVAAHA